jgi:hypothetical protein
MAPGSTYNQELAKNVRAATPAETQTKYSHLAQLAPRSMKAANRIVASIPTIPLMDCTVSGYPECAKKLRATGIQYPVAIESRLRTAMAIRSQEMIVTDVGRPMRAA